MLKKCWNTIWPEKGKPFLAIGKRIYFSMGFWLIHFVKQVYILYQQGTNTLQIIQAILQWLLLGLGI